VIECQAEQAAAALGAGALIAYPTEAVWGFGCDPHDRHAVSRLLRLKRRPVDKGLLLVAAGTEQLGALLAPLTERQLRLLQNSWPGPVTWLIPDPAPLFPEWIRGSHASVAVRVSGHPVVQAICRAFGGPLVSTSANHAGSPAIRTLAELRRQFGEAIDHVVPGELGDREQPSEIRDLLTGARVR